MRLSLGRLGLRDMVQDNLATWVETGRNEQERTSVSDWIVFVGVPLSAGIVAALLGVRLYSLDPILAGAAIMTGLLFGLLVHVLSLGLQLAGDPKVTRGSRLARLVDELRANITWACVVGLALSAITTVVWAASKDLDQVGTNPWVSGAIVALILHLGLTLLMILKRVRTTYRLTSK